jgi:predicted PurR-regulated permease PerM
MIPGIILFILYRYFAYYESTHKAVTGEIKMENNKTTEYGLKFWVIAASFVIVIAGLKAAASIVIPLLLSLLLASICYAPFIWLQKKKVPDMIAILIVLIGILALAFLIVALLGTSVSGFADKVPFYEQKFASYWSDINQWLVANELVGEDMKLHEKINPGGIISIAGGVFTGFGNLMSNSFIIVLIVIFILLELSSMLKKMGTVNSESLPKLEIIMQKQNQYFSAKTLVSLITGILISIILAIIGVDFPLLWGALAFILNFIPNIGSIIAAIPACLLALVQISPLSALFTAIAYLAVNMVMGNIVEPRLIGKTVGLSPLIVFLSLIFWGWVLGIVGMLLATPLTITIKIVFDSMDSTKHIGLMMGDDSSIPESSQKS